MSKSTYRLNLDVHKDIVQTMLNVKQSDSARNIIFTLSDGGNPFEIESGCTATLMALKPDGTELFNYCTIEGDTIVYELTSQTSAAVGIVECELRLYNSNNTQITSPRFNIRVTENVYADGDIESRNQFTALQVAMTGANNLDISANKSGRIATITITKKDGTEKELFLCDGANLTDVLISDGILRMTVSDGNTERTYNVGRVKGDKGDKGDKGETGSQGPKGETGPQGPKGDDAVTDAHYYPTSNNAQSGKAVAEAIAELNVENGEGNSSLQQKIDAEGGQPLSIGKWSFAEGRGNNFTVRLESKDLENNKITVAKYDEQGNKIDGARDVRANAILWIDGAWYCVTNVSKTNPDNVLTLDAVERQLEDQDGHDVTVHHISDVAIGTEIHAYMGVAAASASHIEGNFNNTVWLNSRYEKNEDNVNRSHAEGSRTLAAGYCAHTEGEETLGNGNMAHAEGKKAKAIGDVSHAEGNQTIAEGDCSHSEGKQTKAQGNSGHAEGIQTEAIGIASHAEGNRTIAEGDYSHSEGYGTNAVGKNSHVSGQGTIANYDNQTAIGKYNNNKPNTLFEIGNGTSGSNRKNAFEVYSDGRASVGANPTSYLDVATKQYTDNHHDDTKQDATDNSLNTSNKSIVLAINEVNSIAKGAQQAISYVDYKTMIDVFNVLPAEKYNIGQNIYIKTVNVPDVWISNNNEATCVTYDIMSQITTVEAPTFVAGKYFEKVDDEYFVLAVEPQNWSTDWTDYYFVDDDKFANALKVPNNSIQVGYYSFSQLETQKVDLTNYYTKSQADNKLLDKVDKEDGKGLSTEDYTTADKTKLNGIQAGAQVNNPVDAHYYPTSNNAQSGKAVAEAINPIMKYITYEFTYIDPYTGEYTGFTITGCSTDISGDHIIPDKIWGVPVTSIAENAFRNCSGLTGIVIPDSVKEPVRRAFVNCTGLTSVTIGNSVPTIDYRAFYGCSALQVVKIPVSVTLIKDEAFSGCSSLDTIYYMGTQSQWSSVAKSSSGNSTFINATKYYNQAPAIVQNIKDNWRTIADVTTDTASSMLTITVDSNNKSFILKQLRVYLYIPQKADAEYTNGYLAFGVVGQTGYYCSFGAPSWISKTQDNYWLIEVMPSNSFPACANVSVNAPSLIGGNVQTYYEKNARQSNNYTRIQLAMNGDELLPVGTHIVVEGVDA